MLTRLLFALILFVASVSCREERLVIVFGGDVMLDRGIRQYIERQGFASLADDIAPVFRNADYAFVNLECAVTELHAPETKKFVFRGDPSLLPMLKDAGITHAVLANNHSYDHGRAGLTSTAENLVANGLVPVGYGASQRAACEPLMLTKGDIRVALFSSVTLTLENWMYLENSPGMCQATIDDLVNTIKALRAKDPAVFIITTLHWGVEYQQFPTSFQRDQARMLIDAGCDAIIGHHPHVVQRYESINGKPVFYSIGNLIFDNPNPITHEGILVQLTLTSATHDIDIIPYKTENLKPRLLADDERMRFFNNLQKYSDKLP